MHTIVRCSPQQNGRLSSLSLTEFDLKTGDSQKWFIKYERSLIQVATMNNSYSASIAAPDEGTTESILRKRILVSRTNTPGEVKNDEEEEDQNQHTKFESNI